MNCIKFYLSELKDLKIIIKLTLASAGKETSTAPLLKLLAMKTVQSRFELLCNLADIVVPHLIKSDLCYDFRKNPIAAKSNFDKLYLLTFESVIPQILKIRRMARELESTWLNYEQMAQFDKQMKSINPLIFKN